MLYLYYLICIMVILNWYKVEYLIKEELSQRIAKPVEVKKIQQGKIIYAGKYQIASNFVGSRKQKVIDLLKDTKTSELKAIF